VRARRVVISVLAAVTVGVAAAGAAAAGTPPSNTSPPTISGFAVQGHVLTASPGVWSGTQPISFAYQWLRCDQGGGNCSAVVGAKTQRYKLSAADVGHTMKVTVTATNAAGTGTATSAATAVIASAVPVNTSPPTISGTAQQGQTLTAEAGNWSGTRPLKFGFHWHRCDASGAGCVHIDGATDQTYVVSATDVGHTLRVAVTATNAFGTGTARSAPTAVVTAAPGPTLASSRGSVTYGGSVRLSGSVAGAGAGLSVSIWAQVFGRSGPVRVASVATASNGSFSVAVKPRIRTVYFARLSGGPAGNSVAIAVRPRMRLAVVGKHLFSLNVYASRSFVGRIAYVQRWSIARHRWLTIGPIHMRSARYGPTVVTTKPFVLRVAHGLRLRVRMPLSQSTTGYITGVSNTIRA